MKHSWYENFDFESWVLRLAVCAMLVGLSFLMLDCGSGQIGHETATVTNAIFVPAHSTPATDDKGKTTWTHHAATWRLTVQLTSGQYIDMESPNGRPAGARVQVIYREGRWTHAKLFPRLEDRQGSSQW